MMKLTTTMMQETLNKRDGRLTVGLDLGDRSSFYCVLDETGDVLLEQKVSTTPKRPSTRFSERCPGVVLQWRPERIHRGSADCLVSSVMRPSWRTHAACD